MSGRFKPHRRMRSEVLTLAIAISVPVVLLSVFPVEAVHPLSVPADRDGEIGHCAFVELTPDEERQAIAAARAAWQLDKEKATLLRVDLLVDSLPSESPCAVTEFPSRSRGGHAEPELYRPDAIPVSLAAPAPAKIAPQPDADAVSPTFAREELLKLD